MARFRLVKAVAVLGVANAVYQRVSEERDRRAYPPPGRMVDVGGRSLHCVARGSGGPTIVIECGGGEIPHGAWDPVVEELARTTTVVTYDRGGFGWSDAAPWPRSCTAIADDLHTLLDRLGAPRPFVLVGHSLGGLYVRAFAAGYPAAVGGMVLIDATHEDLLRRVRAELGAGRVGLMAAISLGMAAVPRGPLRVGIALGPLRTIARAVIGGDSDDDFRLRAALYLRGAFRNAHLGEMLAFPRTANQVRRAGRLGVIPLAVVTRAEPPAGDTSIFARHWDAWVGFQKQLADLSDDSVHVLATTGGHFVFKDESAVVIDAVKGVIDRAHAVTT